MLGGVGFNAFVVDVYGKGIRPNTPETCEAEMMKHATNRPLLRERARCGFDQLRKVPNTDLSKMAAIGYCFGRLAVLEMARDGQNDLAGVVSFHGVLATATPLKPDTYKGKILVLHGVDDPVVPDDQTMAFWKEMRDAKANWEFVAYGNALHTFTNWLMPEDGPPPAVYNKQAIGAHGSPCRISSKRFLPEKSTPASACDLPSWPVALGSRHSGVCPIPLPV